MTDKEKLNRVRAEVLNYIDAAHKAHTNFAHLFSFIDSLQEEPETPVWHDNKETPVASKTKIVLYTNGKWDLFKAYKADNDFDNYWANVNQSLEEKGVLVKHWAYVSDLLKISDVKDESTEKDWILELQNKLDSLSKEDFKKVWAKYGAEEKEEPVSDDFTKSLAECIHQAQGSVTDPMVFAELWKDELIKLAKSEEPVSEDLGEYINELSKQFPEVSFAKLSRIAVRVAKWQKSNLWKSADGDNLPEIDREVIALLNDGKVVFAHRPYKGKYIGKNLTTGNIETFENKTYDEGGWNIPNVKWWLDCQIPK